MRTFVVPALSSLSDKGPNGERIASALFMGRVRFVMTVDPVQKKIRYEAFRVSFRPYTTVYGETNYCINSYGEPLWSRVVDFTSQGLERSYLNAVSTIDTIFEECYNDENVQSYLQT